MIFRAIVPPSNIIKEIESYKRELFRLLKIVAPIAIPPLIPLSWGADVADLSSIDPRSFPPCEKMELKDEEGTLFLAVLDNTGQSILSNLNLEAPVNDLGVPGFFLMNRVVENFKKTPLLPPPPKLRWKVWEVVDFCLIIHNQEEWWNNVALEEIIPRLIKK